MASKTCAVCGGQYERDQPGGVYLHACAPVLDKVIVQRAGALLTLAPGSKLGGDVEVDRTYKERANKVDETVPATKG